MCMKTTRANTVEPSDAVNRCTAAHVTSHHNTLSSSYTRTMFKRQHVLVPNHRFLLSWPSEIGRSTSTSSHTSSRHIILSGPLFKGRTRRPVWPYRYPSNRTHRAHILVPLIKRDFHSQPLENTGFRFFPCVGGLSDHPLRTLPRVGGHDVPFGRSPLST